VQRTASLVMDVSGGVIKELPAFLPMLHACNQAVAPNVPSAYPDSPPTKISKQSMEQHISGDTARLLVDKIGKSNVDFDGSNRADKPVHIFFLPRNGTPAFAAPHTDPHAVLLVMLRGFKTVWVGPRLGDSTVKTFVDTAGCKWKAINDSGTSSSRTIHWAPSDGTDAMNFVCRSDGSYSRVSLCPGDALLLPARQLHAVATNPDSAMLSITVKPREKMARAKWQ